MQIPTFLFAGTEMHSKSQSLKAFSCLKQQKSSFKQVAICLWSYGASERVFYTT